MQTFSLPLLTVLLGTIMAGVVPTEEDPYSFTAAAPKRNLGGFSGYVSVSVNQRGSGYYTPTYSYEDLGTYDEKYGQYSSYNTYYQR